MAGIFGDDLNSRQDFFDQLTRAEKACAQLIHKHPDEDELGAVQRQLEAIRKWTNNGRKPTAKERESLDMGLRLFREYEMTDDQEIADFRDLISILHSYLESWPSDKAAADPDNDEYL
jgi:hypothetical protein